MPTTDQDAEREIPVVATLHLPIAADGLDLLNRGLERCYPDGPLVVLPDPGGRSDVMHVGQIREESDDADH